MNSNTDKAFIIDMDGVIYTENNLIPGALSFIEKLQEFGYKFLFLTNNSYFTPAQLKSRLAGMGIDVKEEHFYTSAMATANFLDYQKKGCSAYVIGGEGILRELALAGIRVTDVNPDYVIVGETEKYDYENIIRATIFIQNGSKFIATNSDITAPTSRGLVPACGALVAPIAKVTRMSPYFLGKPNPVMMYWARKILGMHSASCFMIGDRMETDILGGIESGMTTCLVLTGVTKMKNVHRYPFQPDYIFNGIDEIDPRTIQSRRPESR